jgi:hypothetical protein
MVAGIAAGAQLDKLKTSLQSKAVLREVFDAADVDESGALDSTELADLCAVREKRPLLRHFYAKNPNICQDRLGTDVRKVDIKDVSAGHGLGVDAAAARGRHRFAR